MQELFIKDTKSILDMLRKEVPLQIKMSALLKASILSAEDKRSNLEKAITHFEEKLKITPADLQTKKTLERLKKELEEGSYQTTNADSEISFDKESLRKRLHVIFGAYLAYLEENDTEGFKKAMEIIEKGISESRRTLSKAKKSLGTTGRKPKTTQNAEDVESAIARRANEFFAPTDKLSKSLFDRRKNTAFYEKPEVFIDVGTKGGKPVTTLVSINIDKLEGVTLSSNIMLNPYNRAIHDAVVSLHVAGNTHFTPRMVYETLNGGTRIHKPPEQICEDIRESIRKMMHTIMKIDATEEAKAFRFEALKFEGALLPVTLTTAKINGQVIECFKFLAEPPLYTYASRKKQISRCDIKLLSVDLNITPENVVIRDYLLEQITSMQSQKSKLLNVIKYNTLYEYLGIDAPTAETLRAKKRDVRTKVRTILNAWVREGFIQSYEEQKEGTAITKVMIHPAENTQRNNK